MIGGNMNDIFDIGPTKKEMALGFLGMFVILVLAFSAGYHRGIRDAGTDVYDNGNAAQHVREEIGSAGSSVGAAKSGIDNAAIAAGRIEERISDAQERAGYLQGTVNEGRRIVAECQSVLREVRARGQARKAKD